MGIELDTLHEMAAASAWSDDPPEVDGWFWWRASDEHRPSIKLVWNSGVALIVKWGGETKCVTKIGGQWQPVEEPRP